MAAALLLRRRLPQSRRTPPPRASAGPARRPHAADRGTSLPHVPGSAATFGHHAGSCRSPRAASDASSFPDAGADRPCRRCPPPPLGADAAESSAACTAARQGRAPPLLYPTPQTTSAHEIQQDRNSSMFADVNVFRQISTQPGVVVDREVHTYASRWLHGAYIGSSLATLLGRIRMLGPSEQTSACINSKKFTLCPSKLWIEHYCLGTTHTP